MTAPRFDIAVVGGGPAGAAAAISLRDHDPGRSVVVIEASTYASARIGETLHPSARPLLERLGVWERFVAEGHREAYGTVSAWGGLALGGDEFHHVGVRGGATTSTGAASTRC